MKLYEFTITDTFGQSDGEIRDIATSSAAAEAELRGWANGYLIHLIKVDYLVDSGTRYHYEVWGTYANPITDLPSLVTNMITPELLVLDLITERREDLTEAKARHLGNKVLCAESLDSIKADCAKYEQETEQLEAWLLAQVNQRTGKAGGAW